MEWNADGARFELLLFSVDPPFIREAVAAGIDAIIVDWERLGKENRQANADTQINHHTVDDLRRVRACTDARVICRLNRFGPTTHSELNAAIREGADEVLLPMVEHPCEVATVLQWARGRCDVGMLIETMAAVEAAEQFALLPLSRVYVGLNDLAIERGSAFLFDAVADGIVENVRRRTRARFGFGGLTLPELGHPIPCRLLMSELSRLRCDFTFLRRSFCADVQGRDMRFEVPRMRNALGSMAHRTPADVICDREELYAAIRASSREREAVV